MEDMAVEIKKTRDAIMNMDILSKMEGLRKILEKKPKIYAAAAAKPKEVVDAREMGVVVDRVRNARNQKVVLSYASQEAIKRIEARIKIRRHRSLVKETKRPHHPRSQLGKVEARVRYRRRAKNPLECHPVLEVSPALYTRLIKAGHIYVGLQLRPVWNQSPLVQCSRCRGFGHNRKYCREEAILSSCTLPPNARTVETTTPVPCAKHVKTLSPQGE
ncbi:hypothetical protein EVAR_60634_1 [Eumeta japonica]|uniref:Uncharacterized protein n=1 Tax=Eumeta variegata TaxID=151549 RepID=A0A4C1ZLR9_EUMVA|nr:hypothetical protein EVAR_60634_1 [Eumeta japonica]